MPKNVLNTPFHCLQRVHRYSSEFFNNYLRSVAQQDFGQITIKTVLDAVSEQGVQVKKAVGKSSDGILSSRYSLVTGN